MGLLTNNDALLFRSFFKEAAFLRGIEAEYRHVLSQKVTNHSEFIYELSEPEDMDIIFDQNPTVSTLRKIGWVSEGSDDKPYIAQLPFNATDLKIGCVISLKSLDLNSQRDFKITSINTLLEYPDCWTCTLAPIFFSNEARTEYTVKNYNYIDTPDADIQNDAPDNNFNFLNVKE